MVEGIVIAILAAIYVFGSNSRGEPPAAPWHRRFEADMTRPWPNPRRHNNG